MILALVPPRQPDVRAELLLAHGRRPAPVRTEVRDDPGACRSTANWLGRLKAGVQHIGDVSYRERGESESFWQGTAGDSCRRELSDLGMHEFMNVKTVWSSSPVP